MVVLILLDLQVADHLLDHLDLPSLQNIQLLNQVYTQDEVEQACHQVTGEVGNAAKAVFKADHAVEEANEGDDEHGVGELVLVGWEQVVDERLVLANHQNHQE